MHDRLEDGIGYLTGKLLRMQAPDGSWRLGFFEEGTTTDAASVLLFASAFPEREAAIRKLSGRIEAKQRPEGWWTVYPDEAEGNASATAECYFALLAAGRDPGGPAVRKAGEALRALGGRRKVDSLYAKFLLAASGFAPWPKWFPVPIALMLLPLSAPIHFYRFSGYARVHMAPMLLLGDRKPAIAPAKPWPETDIVREFRAGIREEDDIVPPASARDGGGPLQWLQTLGSLPKRLREQAGEHALRYMLDRLEPDGTLYGYATATVLMAFALLGMGFPRTHPVLRGAVDGMEAFLLEDRADGLTTLQNTTSTVWDTALISHALQKAGLSAAAPAVRNAGAFLLRRQHDRTGDWLLGVRQAAPGGWGFSDVNTINPDVDDTTAALRAIHRLRDSPAYEAAHNRGLQWLLAMQNGDGGWAAFERNGDSPLLKRLPLDGAEDAATDPSSADLTGRTLEYLGGTLRLTGKLPFIRRAIDWLYLRQELNGSWYGRWGVCYIYGTWAALTGLTAAGESPDHPQIRQAADWLRYIQHDDGGFGESCFSDKAKRYVPLGFSTLSQTAWALDALVAVNDRPDEAVKRAADYLLRHLRETGPAANYPTGGALPGHMYTRYESYPYVWPLLALSNYRLKYASDD